MADRRRHTTRGSFGKGLHSRRVEPTPGGSAIAPGNAADGGLIAEAQEHFRLFYERSPLAYQSLNTDGHILEVNPAWLGTLGYERGEVVGRWFGDFLTPEFQQGFAERFARFKETGEIKAIQFDMLSKDGRVVCVEFDGRASYAADGRFERSHCVMRDITERRRAEERLRAASSMLDLAPSSITVHDFAGRFLYANRRTFEIHGHEDHEFMALNLRDLDVPESAALIAERMDLVATQGEASFEVAHRRKDGSILPLEVYVKLVTWDGVPAVLSIGTDITERKRAQESLREREEIYSAIVNQAADSIVLIDTDTLRFAEFNDAACQGLGHTREEFARLTLREIQGVLSPEELDDRVRKLIRTGGGSFENQQRRKDGALRDVQIANRLVSIRGRNYLAGIWRDITECKQAQADREALIRTVEQKNRDLENLVFVASHDLRTPLLNVQGFSRRIEKLCGELQQRLEAVESRETREAVLALTGEKMPQALQFILAGVDRMDRLIDGMLRVSRLGRSDIRMESLEVDRLVRDIVTVQSFAIQSAQATVAVEPLPACVGDAALISQIFSNLLDNALKYRDPTRSLCVDISGATRDTNAVYCVADNGLGIPPEHLERIWDLFHRVQPFGAVTGEGLGLSLVRRAVERHQGKAWVESTAGEGSRFFLMLPCRHNANGATP